MRRSNLIGVFAVDWLDAAAPPAPVILDQFLGRGAASASDCKQGIEEMCLVLAALVAAGAAVQSVAGDLEDLERDVAQGAAAMRCVEPEARDLDPHCLALRLAPVGDEVASRIERGAVVEQADAQRRQ